MPPKTLTRREPLTKPIRAADLREGDLLILAKPMRPSGLVPACYPELMQIEVLRVLPGGGNDGEDVVHVFIWDTQSWSFAEFDRRLDKGMFRVERPLTLEE